MAFGWAAIARLDQNDHPRRPRRTPDIDLDDVVQANLGAIAAALAIAIVLLLLLVVAQARRIGRLDRRLESLTKGEEGASLEAILGQHLERVHEVVRDVGRLEARTANVERDLATALGHVGFVRYNPFEDTGGAFSFALAILDKSGSGFVVSSLHARTGTRIYAKPIEAGKSEATLSSEETEAVRRAMAAPNAPAPAVPPRA